MNSDAVNTVLYALSTVAQTCAALAALVGALALYRLQSMRETHASDERMIRTVVQPFDSDAIELAEVISAARKLCRELSATHGARVLRPALAKWNAFPGRHACAVRWLVVFEAWNLSAILAALVGFACPTWLASRWWLFAGLLLVVSVATVSVTGAALYFMARPDDSAPSTEPARRNAALTRPR